jgi:hypothetical protein
VAALIGKNPSQVPIRDVLSHLLWTKLNLWWIMNWIAWQLTEKVAGFAKIRSIQSRFYGSSRKQSDGWPNKAPY